MAARSRKKSQPQSEIRTEFKTKEGYYRNLRSHRYSKPRGLPLLGKELSQTRVSVVSVKDMQGLSEWVLFNSGKEFFCYPFSATERVPDLINPVDKHSYRASYPLSHDVNQTTRSVDSLDLVIGFNGGPLQRINPITKSSIALYNNDRLIDSTDVTCVRWVPGSETHFVSSHMSGNLYTWNTDHKYKSSNLPTFSQHKQLTDTTVHVSRPKNRFPVVNRWTVGHGPITAFAFSPDTTHIAVANQDGFLRIYNFHSFELYGRMRSYYGGFLCVCWSPDGKYVVTGGEDDLVSVWSYQDKCVVTRAEGHHSYVNGVSFDPYITESEERRREEEEEEATGLAESELRSRSRSSRFFDECSSYRVGSVGQDGLVCLWEFTSDSLTIQRRGGWSRTRPTITKQASSGDGLVEEGKEGDKGRPRSRPLTLKEGQSPSDDSAHPESSIGKGGGRSEGREKAKRKLSKQQSSDTADVELTSPVDPLSEGAESSVSSDSSKSKKKKSIVKSATKKIKNFVNVGGGGGGGGYEGDALSPRHLNNFESCESDDIAPKMSEVNVVEPLVCKKVWSERLTDVVFREDCLLLATEDGFVHLWARPGRSLDSPTPSNPGLNSPKPSNEGTTAGGLQEAKHTSV